MCVCVFESVKHFNTQTNMTENKNFYFGRRLRRRSSFIVHSSHLSVKHWNDKHIHTHTQRNDLWIETIIIIIIEIQWQIDRSFSILIFIGLKFRSFSFFFLVLVVISPSIYLQSIPLFIISCQLSCFIGVCVLCFSKCICCCLIVSYIYLFYCYMILLSFCFVVVF